ncbi:MAG: hypothetical protein QXH27_05260 [Candidatus Micrarchaeia archaeon]
MNRTKTARADFACDDKGNAFPMKPLTDRLEKAGGRLASKRGELMLVGESAQDKTNKGVENERR